MTLLESCMDLSHKDVLNVQAIEMESIQIIDASKIPSHLSLMVWLCYFFHNSLQKFDDYIVCSSPSKSSKSVQEIVL
ncbi:hypothetical protein DASC09_044450 [Saccharomycopsis crataegensis]|uniref:Uncharacterized protein n=1 Tax=Saccharomycopsis crataegensis TaxID=43959 RepID=A0AAV5QQA0_9ASCO|nr:hypothetical protein DASC09_044450 [Saccharomycopsis crataegensis]